VPSKQEKSDDDCEQRRRDWAALQNPELVTTQQAVEMFGRVNFPEFKKFLSDNGIGAKVAPNFRAAFFYEKSKVAILAVEYLISHPPSSRVGRKYKTEKIAESCLGLIRKLPEKGWNIQEFIDCWQSDSDCKVAKELIARSISIQLFTPEEAYNFIKMIARLNGHHYRILGNKYDYLYFRKAIVDYVAFQRSKGLEIKREDVAFVKDFSLKVYNTTDMGVFNPYIAVAVLFELRLSR
jgi:hypothetical protein